MSPVERFRAGLEHSTEHGGYATEGEAIDGANAFLDYVAEDSFEFDGDPEDAASLLVAIYWWAVHCHGGQWSDLYALGCKAQGLYTPGCGEHSPEPDSMDQVYYLDLCQLSGCDGVGEAQSRWIGFGPTFAVKGKANV